MPVSLLFKFFSILKILYKYSNQYSKKFLQKSLEQKNSQSWKKTTFWLHVALSSRALSLVVTSLPVWWAGAEEGAVVQVAVAKARGEGGRGGVGRPRPARGGKTHVWHFIKYI